MLDIILDALLDSLKMLPFLFLTYWLLEYVEHRGSEKFSKALQKSGRFGPLGGAVIGCVPQCGFSVAAANLFSARLISAGTLIAVFVSTSDEAVPILLANPQSASLILKLILYKVCFAILAGFLLDLLCRGKFSVGYETDNKLHSDCHNVISGKQILLSAVKHTLYITIFVFAVLLLINLVIFYVGEERLTELLMSNSIWQPVIAALIGFIPNCAPSVLLTQLYITGGLDFGALFAGLSTAAGMGLVLLFKNNHNLRQNLLLLLYIFLLSTAVGMLL